MSLSNARARHGLASLLFLVSGFTGLGYEVLWFKRFGHLWGSSSLALASVVASFLLGLGIGALAAGPLADRMRRPLRAYGWCEVGIALLALAVPFEIGLLFEHSAGLQASLQGRPLLHALARLGLTFAVIGPPTILMGATLPLLARQFASGGYTLGASASWLYAFNALGAAAGAWLVGYHMMAALGVRWTNALLVAVNLAVAAAAIALARRMPAPPSGAAAARAAGEPEARAAPAPPALPPGEPFAEERVPLGALCAAAALTGCAALVLQMLWARVLALLLGPTTFALTAMIGVFILGLGLGSLAFQLGATRAARMRPLVVACAAAIVVATLAGLTLAPGLALAVGALRGLRAYQGWNGIVCTATSAVLELAPTFAMGALFPALVQLSREGAARAGRVVGSVYAWSTLGSIAGATITAAVLFPALGTYGTARAALVLYAAALLVLFPPLRARNRPVLFWAAGAALVSLLWPLPDPLRINLGMYMYGTDEYSTLRENAHVAFFEEGRTANVLVLEEREMHPERVLPEPPRHIDLRIDGKVDATNGADMPMQLAMAYVPRFLRPRAREVLAIGLGSGTTSGASLLFPGARVTCCEIEPAVAAAARRFGEVNHHPFDSERFELVADDGRSFVQGTGRVFDLILSQPSNPWIAGVSNLYTREFYEAALRRLSASGVFAQWVQVYSFRPEDYALVVRTLLSVFPRCAMVRINDFDTLLLGARGAIVPSPADIDLAQSLVDASPAVRADLERYFPTTDVRALLLEGLVLDHDDLRRLASELGGGEINTDLNLHLEFSAPRALFQIPAGAVRENVRTILSAADGSQQRDLLFAWGGGREQIEALRRLKTTLFQRSLPALALSIVRLAGAMEPDDPELMADELLFAPPQDPIELRQAAEHLSGLSPMEAYRLGRLLAQNGAHQPARIVLEVLSERLPESATIWTSLGVVYAALGREEEAREAIERAQGMDPLNELTRSIGRTIEEAE